MSGRLGYFLAAALSALATGLCLYRYGPDWRGGLLLFLAVALLMLGLRAGLARR